MSKRTAEVIPLQSEATVNLKQIQIDMQKIYPNLDFENLTLAYGDETFGSNLSEEAARVADPTKLDPWELPSFDDEGNKHFWAPWDEPEQRVDEDALDELLESKREAYEEEGQRALDDGSIPQYALANTLTSVGVEELPISQWANMAEIEVNLDTNVADFLEDTLCRYAQPQYGDAIKAKIKTPSDGGGDERLVV